MGYFDFGSIDAELTQIHRQEQCSVLELATKLRQGQGIQTGTYEHALIRDYSWWQKAVENSPETFANAGFVIVDKHTTRRKVNRAIRSLHYGRDTYHPEPGDRLLICRNCPATGLSNGDTITINALERRDDINGYVITAYTHGETGEEISGKAEAFAIPVNRLAQTYDAKPTKLNRKALEKADLPMIPVDYGWAITCHAAQGSERDNVIVIGSWMGGTDLETKYRWAYTALTRARQYVIAYILPLPPLQSWQDHNARNGG